MQTLHTRIKSARLKRSWSQSQLADAAGVSQPTVANWETGSHIPRQSTLARISQALDVDTGWLLSGTQFQVQSSMDTYLSLPIRHIPIHAWPKPGEGLLCGAPIGYIPYPTNLENAYALTDRADDSIQHRILIFDPDITGIRPDKLCLWTDGFTAQMTPHKKKPPGAASLGQLKTEILNY